MAMYRFIYFDGDKSLSIVPQSKCILRQSFEEGNEVEVSWKNKKGAKQIWLGVIVKIASKGESEILYDLYYLAICKRVVNAKLDKTRLQNHFMGLLMYCY